MNRGFDDKTLLIIPCCKKKKSGGIVLPTNYIDPLSVTVSKNQYNAIIEARKPLKLNGHLQNTEQYMPAIDRYAGTLYKIFDNISECIRTYTNSENCPKLIILSALYGPLHPESLINNYNLEMPKGRNQEWYQAFPSFLESYVNNQQIENIRFYVGRTTGYYDVVSNSVRPLLRNKSLRLAIHLNVIDGGTFVTPYNHGLQLASDLSCATSLEFNRTVEAVNL